MDDSIYLSAYESLLYSFKLDMAVAVAEERYEDAAKAKAKAEVVRKMFSALLPTEAIPSQ